MRSLGLSCHHRKFLGELAANGAIDVMMMRYNAAPSNLKQLEENLAAVREGALGKEDMEFMRQFGDVVHQQKKWFM